MTSEQIAELRTLTHRCKGGLPPCECDLPELLGADPNAHDAPLPLLQRLLDEREALLGALKEAQRIIDGEVCSTNEHGADCRNLLAVIAKAESP